jgi:hypothetical protein
MKLVDYLEQLPKVGTYTLDIPVTKKTPARQATMEVRCGNVVIPRPRRVSARVSKSGIKEINMWVVEAREINPPKNVEPTRWVLLTSDPVNNFDDARRILEKNERQKKREHEIDDGRRFVLVNVVQTPVGRCYIEAIVLDVPPPMPRVPIVPRGRPLLAERSRPIPGGSFVRFLPLPGNAFSAVLGLQGLQYPQRFGHALRGAEAFLVPVLDGSPALGPLSVRGSLGE